MSFLLAADSPLVDWSSLGEVILISALAGLAIAVVLGFGIVSSLRASDERGKGNGSTAVALNGITVVAIAAVAAAIGVGIYYIANK